MAKNKRSVGLDEARALARARRWPDAEAAYRRVVAKRPSLVAAHRELAQVLVQSNQAGKAVESLQRATRVIPKEPALWTEMALLLGRGGAWDAAREAALRAISLAAPKDDALVRLADSALASSRTDVALTILKRLHDACPDDHDVRLKLAHAYLNNGEPDLAIPLYEVGLTSSDDVVTWISLGTALRLVGRTADARSACEKALSISPENPDAIAGLVQCCESEGDSDGAFTMASDALSRGISSNNLVLAFVRVARRVGAQAEAIGVVKTELARENLQPRRRSALLFNLGTLCEDLEQYDDAFDAYREANRLQQGRFNRAQAEQFTTMSIAFFDAGRLKTLARASHDTSRAIFIVGMPRSGTSLIEQILASHPDIAGGGELPDVPRLVKAVLMDNAATKPRYPDILGSLSQAEIDEASRAYLETLRSVDASTRHVTDKLPLNFRHLGYIAMLCPQAKVIHCCRDPLDTCVSCYTTALTSGHTYANDLGDLGATYVEYQRLMSHWHDVLDLPILDLSYDDLVADPEAGARRLIDFVGLAWDDACLSSHENTRIIPTASIDQVRRPIYTTSRKRHERFAAHLGPLREQLG